MTKDNHTDKNASLDNGGEGGYYGTGKDGYSPEVLAAGGDQPVIMPGYGIAPKHMAEMWKAAVESGQSESPEFVQTWNDIVAELGGTARIPLPGD